MRILLLGCYEDLKDVYKSSFWKIDLRIILNNNFKLQE